MTSSDRPVSLFILAACALAGVALVLPSCRESPTSGAGGGGAGGAAKVAAIEVELAPLVRRSVRETIDVSGTFFAEEDAVISAKLGGRVEQLPKDVGDSVEPGELLAQIEKRDYELAVAEQRAALSASLARLGLTQLPAGEFQPSEVPTVVKARAEASNAQSKFERARTLFEQKPALIPEQEFADARTAWEVARSEADVAALTAQATLAEARRQAAALETALQRLADTAVAAPRVDGRPNLHSLVAARMVSTGELVAPGRPLFRLVATDMLKYRVRVPQRFSAQVKPGQETIARGESGSHSGRVSRVSPVVDPESRTFSVEILIDNAAGTLKPGTFGEGVIITGVRDNAAMVPERAISSFAGVHRVYSVSGGKAIEHRVELGVRDDGLVEVVGDIDADAVVITGLSGLAPGAAVSVRGAAPGK